MTKFALDRFKACFGRGLESGLHETFGQTPEELLSWAKHWWDKSKCLLLPPAEAIAPEDRCRYRTLEELCWRIYAEAFRTGFYSKQTDL